MVTRGARLCLPPRPKLNEAPKGPQFFGASRTEFFNRIGRSETVGGDANAFERRPLGTLSTSNICEEERRRRSPHRTRFLALSTLYEILKTEYSGLRRPCRHDSGQPSDARHLARSARTSHEANSPRVVVHGGIDPQYGSSRFKRRLFGGLFWEEETWTASSAGTS